MTGKICFFEPNTELAEKFIDYWMSHGLSGCTICYYSDAEIWKEQAAGLRADLWILDTSLRAYAELVARQHVLWWTDDIQDTEALFKYRSAALLLHAIQEQLTGKEDKKGSCIISLYSPIKRCMQTTFGMHLAQLLTQRGRVLYINLEGYSGQEYLTDGAFSKDISDFIYDINQSTKDISIMIQNYIERIGEVDRIAPVLNPCNLQEITEEMWIHLLRTLQECGLYEYVLLDLSDFVQGRLAILQESRVIFSVKRSGAKEQAKWQQYYDVLDKTDGGHILEKTQSVVIPEEWLENGSGAFANIVKQAGKEAGLL